MDSELDLILTGYNQMEYTDNGIAPLTREQALAAFKALLASEKQAAYRDGQIAALEELQLSMGKHIHDPGGTYKCSSHGDVEYRLARLRSEQGEQS